MSLAETAEGLHRLRNLRLVRLSAAEVPQVRDLLDTTLEVQYDSVFYHQLMHSPRVFGFIAVVPFEDTVDGSAAFGSGSWSVVGAVTAKCELSVTQISRSSSGVPKIYLTALSVDPAWRRLHVGLELLRCTLDYVREVAGPQGVNVDLHCLRTNDAAIALYEKFGFVQRQQVPGFYSFGGGRHDAVQMRVHVVPLRNVLRSPPRPHGVRVPDSQDPKVKSAATTTSSLHTRATRATLPHSVAAARRLMWGDEAGAVEEGTSAGSLVGSDQRPSRSPVVPPTISEDGWLGGDSFCAACCQCLQAVGELLGCLAPPAPLPSISQAGPGEGSPLLEVGGSVPMLREASMDSTTTHAGGRPGHIDAELGSGGMFLRPISAPQAHLSTSPPLIPPPGHAFPPGTGAHAE